MSGDFPRLSYVETLRMVPGIGRPWMREAVLVLLDPDVLSNGSRREQSKPVRRSNIGE